MPDIGMSRKRSRAEETRIVLEAVRDMDLPGRQDRSGVDFEYCPLCSAECRGVLAAHEPNCPVLLARELLATPEEQPFLMGQSYFVEDRAVRLEFNGDENSGPFIEHEGDAQIYKVDVPDESVPNMGRTLFLEIKSWDETQKHEVLSKFVGKKVKITVTIEDLEE